jgi:hypothetical protein
VSDHTFALTNRCFPLFSPRKIVMKNWLKDKKIYLGDTPLGDRHFTPELSTFGLRFMDIITGTMYLPSGQCLSSNFLKVNSFTVLNADITKLVNELVKSKRGVSN